MASPHCVAEMMAKPDQGGEEVEVREVEDALYGRPACGMLMPGSVSVLLMNWFDRAEGLHGAIQNTLNFLVRMWNTSKILVRHKGSVKVVLIISGRVWGKRNDILTIKATRWSP
jgi:hypothetical protein